MRDDGAAYGPHEVDAEAFPAAAVLEDLGRAPDADVAGIVARYAALRSWLLREAGADPALVHHAGRAARRYLAALPGRTDGAPMLRIAVADAGPADFAAAARTAERSRHVEGAVALYRAGYLSARRRGDLPAAARLAADLAGLLRRAGLDGRDLWSRRAERLRRRIARG